jgi:hypothetical protein
MSPCTTNAATLVRRAQHTKGNVECDARSDARNARVHYDNHEALHSTHRGVVRAELEHSAGLSARPYTLLPQRLNVSTFEVSVGLTASGFSDEVAGI